MACRHPDPSQDQHQRPAATHTQAVHRSHCSRTQETMSVFTFTPMIGDVGVLLPGSGMCVSTGLWRLAGRRNLWSLTPRGTTQRTGPRVCPFGKVNGVVETHPVVVLIFPQVGQPSRRGTGVPAGAHRPCQQQAVGPASPAVPLSPMRGRTCSSPRVSSTAGDLGLDSGTVAPARSAFLMPRLGNSGVASRPGAMISGLVALEWRCSGRDTGIPQGRGDGGRLVPGATVPLSETQIPAVAEYHAAMNKYAPGIGDSVPPARLGQTAFCWAGPVRTCRTTRPRPTCWPTCGRSRTTTGWVYHPLTFRRANPRSRPPACSSGVSRTTSSSARKAPKPVLTHIHCRQQDPTSRSSE